MAVHPGAYETLFLVRTKKYSVLKNTFWSPHLLVFHWFHKGLSHFGPFSDPFSSNTSGCAIEFANFEVPLFKNGPFSIGSTIESATFYNLFDPESHFRQVL